MHRFVRVNDRLLRSSPHLRFLMETLRTHPRNLIFPPPFPSPRPMYGIPTHLRPASSTLVSFRIFRRLCSPATVPEKKACEVKRGAAAGGGAGVRVRLSDSEFRENWLSSLSSPLAVKCGEMEDGGDAAPGKIAGGSGWVLGIDPDVRGALAVLKGDGPDISAQVFDTPTLQVLIGKRLRKRLDPRAIVQLLRSLEAPLGTTAYIEQSNPFPKDGRQGWWSGGFGYGLWIGILVASGFSVVPIPSIRWKNQFGLSGCSSSKDDSRSLASSLFPSMSVFLKRKMDHGRAESLLIAAYGKGLKLQPGLQDDTVALECLYSYSVA